MSNKNLTTWQEPELPAYYTTEVRLRSTETDAPHLEDKAITVADRVMDSDDDRLALDAAKTAMAWLGKSGRARTTIIAENAQINQIDTKDRQHILDGLADIAKLTRGHNENNN
jgi:hypothetical protein